MIRLPAILLTLLLYGIPAYAGNIKCGADTTGGGVINQINDCTAGTPFSYGGVTPASTAANSNLCPINLTNCGLRQWRCDADTAAKGNAAPVYSDQASCDNGCNWTAACSAAPFTKTLSGSGVGTICTDSNMTIVVQDAGGGTSYRLGMLDTSPGGTAHWNCEPNIVNQGGTFPQYTPPIVDGWHIINHPGDANDPAAGLDIDFNPYLPANGGTDGWNANAEFCVTPAFWGCWWGNGPACNVDTNGDGTLDAYADPAYERCVHATGVAAGWPSSWHPDNGAGVLGYIYRYQITLANNLYTCGINPTALCQGMAGGTSFSPQYYRVIKTNAGMPGVYASTSCAGTCPTSGYVDATTPPPNTSHLGTQTIGGTKDSYDFYTNLSPTFNPSTSKTCMKAGTCNAEPVCPTGFGCDCANGTTPSCPDNGTFDPAADSCHLPAPPLCPPGFTYDTAAHGCVKAPDCPNGTFNPSTNLCEATVTPACASGYAYNPASQQCEYTMSCPAGTSWDNTLKFCRTATTICPAGKSYDPATVQCTEAAVCQFTPTYALNTTSDQCEATPSCLAGTTYNAGLDKCTAATTCPSGTTLNGTTDKCEASPPCNAGFTYSTTNNRCEKAATSTTTYSCPSGGTLSGTTCTISGSYAATATTTYSCPSGGTLSGTTCTISGSYAATASNYDCEISGGSCSRPYSAYFYPACGGWPNTTPPAGGTWMGQRCNGGTPEIWYRVTTYSCPSGGSLSGTTCYTSSTYAATGTTTYSCSAGTLSGSNCWQSVTCVVGTTLNTTSDKCDATVSCPASTAYDSTNNLCAVASTCANGGTLNTTSDRCQLTPQCSTTGFAYSNSANLCQKAASGSCPASTAYDMGTGYCLASLTCSGGGTQDANNGLLCFLNPTVSCPSGMATGQVNGSTVTCQQPSTCPTSPLISSLDATIGKCKIRGTDLCPTTWGFDAATDACTHTPVCNGTTYDKTAKKCCACASANGCIATAAAPTVNDYFCSPNTCVDITAPGAQVGTSADLTYLQNDVGFNSSGGCAGSVYVFGGRPSKCRPQGFDTAGQDCCAGPATGLASGVCGTDEISTSYSVANRLCHYVGDYCSNSWPLVGCVQTSKMYCCYDSKLPRIVQEQGRPLLKRFNQAYCPSGDTVTCLAQNAYWNTPQTPDCTGIRPEELSSLGPYLGKNPGIDLSEWITDQMNTINGSVASMQTQMQTQVTTFYNLLSQ